jgi:short-subunit dehydrogenase
MLPLDATRDDCVEAGAKKVMRLEGRIDLLVVNAGFAVAPAGAEESSIEQLQLVPHMRRRRAGIRSTTSSTRRVTTWPSEKWK